MSRLQRLIVALVVAVVAVGGSGSALASFPGRAGGFVLSGDDLVGVGTYGGEAGIGVLRVVTRNGLAPAEWSPDGRWVVTVAARPGVGYRVFRYPVDARSRVDRGSRRVVGFGREPAFSPDGAWVVHVRRERGGDRNLWVVRVDGREAHRVVALAGVQGSPDWSPDGEWIAFESESPSFGVWAVRPDGSGLRPLAVGEVAGITPSWSPDGEWVAYRREYSLWLADRAGREHRPLVSFDESVLQEEPAAPSWSPAGDRIAFPLAGISGGGDYSSSLRSVSVSGDQLRREAVGASELSDLIESVAWRPLCTLYGTERADRLRGTPGRDVICGLGGDDRIDGRGGDDVIQGGAGDDTLVGGPGEDWLFGGLGADRIEARDGDPDIVEGGPGRDVLIAQELDERR